MARARLQLPSSDGLVSRFLIACMAIGFIALIAAGIAAGFALQRNQRHNAAIVHTYRVEVAISQLRQAIEQTETARRGYIMTGTPRFLVTYADAESTLAPRLRTLADLTRDNPRQRAAIVGLRRQMATIDAQHRDTNALVVAGEPDAALAMFRNQVTVQPINRIRASFEAMNAEERRLLAIRDAEQAGSQRAFYLVSGIAGALLVLVAVISWLTISRYTRDLGRSRDTLRGLNNTLEDQVAERTADLSLANEEIQRFAYIVSHDLRSPLVNVMGFTAELQAATQSLADLIDRADATAPEIVTEEARLAAREDLPEAIGFIRTSTQKMDRLINAILKLSREGRRTVTAEPLDLAEIVRGIGGSIQHLLDDRDVTLTIEEPLPALTSDRLAIEQILSNLIENASKYRHPGRPGLITVAGRQERGRVVLTVADNGRGIAPSDHQRIFDLFRRSGQQDQPGEGIGLAHVRALAYRLGGTISVSSELGEGSTFRLVFPPVFLAQDQKA